MHRVAHRHRAAVATLDRVDPVRRAVWAALAIYLAPALLAVLAAGGLAILLMAIVQAFGGAPTRMPRMVGLGHAWGVRTEINPAPAR